jgi:peroxiredoxin
MFNDQYIQLDTKNDSSLTEVNVKGQDFVIKFYPMSESTYACFDRWRAFTPKGKYLLDENGHAISFRSRPEMIAYLTKLVTGFSY